jgi:hypothetical protein
LHKNPAQQRGETDQVKEQQDLVRELHEQRLMSEAHQIVEVNPGGAIFTDQRS